VRPAELRLPGWRVPPVRLRFGECLAKYGDLVCPITPPAATSSPPPPPSQSRQYPSCRRIPQ
jgi:hypothetical protein